jgi:hypothetical protein
MTSDAAPSPTDAAGMNDAAGDSATPEPALVLRYDFGGEGTVVRDRAGDADATLMGGATLDGMGGVNLDGSDDYVDLPNGVLSRLHSVTLAAWLTWRGGPCWQRVFDFGSNDAGEGQMGNGLTSLFLTPASCNARVLYASAEFHGGSRYVIVHDAALPQGVPAFVALTFDADRSLMTLYLDGAPVGQRAADFRLADIDDVNNWLGRSQWVQDYAPLRARYDEFRIYDGALDAAEIAAIHERGPDDP